MLGSSTLAGSEFLDHPWVGRYTDAASPLSVADVTVTQLPSSLFDLVDDGGLTGVTWNAGASRYDVTVDGLYVVNFAANFAAAASGGGWLRVTHNNSFAALDSNRVAFLSGEPTYIQVTLTDTWKAGETIGPAYVWQKSGGALDCDYAEIYVMGLQQG